MGSQRLPEGQFAKINPNFEDCYFSEFSDDMSANMIQDAHFLCSDAMIRILLRMMLSRRICSHAIAVGLLGAKV